MPEVLQKHVVEVTALVLRLKNAAALAARPLPLQSRKLPTNNLLVGSFLLFTLCKTPKPEAAEKELQCSESHT